MKRVYLFSIVVLVFFALGFIGYDAFFDSSGRLDFSSSSPGGGGGSGGSPNPNHLNTYWDGAVCRLKSSNAIVTETYCLTYKRYTCVPQANGFTFSAPSFQLVGRQNTAEIGINFGSVVNGRTQALAGEFFVGGRIGANSRFPPSTLRGESANFIIETGAALEAGVSGQLPAEIKASKLGRPGYGFRFETQLNEKGEMKYRIAPRSGAMATINGIWRDEKFDPRTTKWFSELFKLAEGPRKECEAYLRDHKK
jgi:hypothetical protein